MSAQEPRRPAPVESERARAFVELLAELQREKWRRDREAKGDAA